MKNIITRALAVALLTTSISAFAAPGNSKSAKSTDPKQTDSDTTLVIVVDEPNPPKTDQDKAQQDQSDEKSGKQKLIEQQDKQWLHNLQGIYGG